MSPFFTGVVRRVGIVVFCAVAISGLAQTGMQSAAELAASGYKAIREKDYKKAAELYQAAVDAGSKSFDSAYNGACAYVLAGDRDRAFAMLNKAVDLGYRDADNIGADADLGPLHADSRWRTVLKQVKTNAENYFTVHRNPDGAKFVTSDVDLFWSVYDELPASKAPEELLTRKYLDAGTVGLQEFIPNRIQNAKNLLGTIRKFPAYYAAIRPNTLTVASVAPEVRESFRKFKAIYDDAVFPDVYFVIGAMNSGGTYGSSGLLLGADMHGLGPGVPINELTPWLKDTVKPYTVLPSIIAHELMHFQQRQEGSSVLAKVIHEGSADFVASLISTGNFNASTYEYGYAHEAELWKQFQRDMHTDDASAWLYGSSRRDGHPADLGYFMGFRISQAYYNRSRDKKQAIREILQVKDFDKLLKDSGYGTQFE